MSQKRKKNGPQKKHSPRKRSTKPPPAPANIVPLAIKAQEAADGEQIPHHPTSRRLRQLNIVQLQRRYGNRYARQFVSQLKTGSVQRDSDAAEEDLTLGELWARAVMENPKLMAYQARDIAKDVGAVLSELKPGEAYFDDLHSVYWGLGKLIVELKAMPEGAKTTVEQRNKANDLAEKWSKVRAGMEAANERRLRRELAKAREGAEKVRLQLLYAYRDIYMAGKEPDEVKLDGLDTMKGFTEKVTDLLKAINEADAAVSGRTVAPIIPVLDKTLAIVNVISGWKVTSPLADEGSKAIAALQNAFSLSTTALGLAGFGKFLPLFSYIGPLLDGIAKGWGALVAALSKKNRLWWEAREVVGDELPHPSAEPGGSAVFAYMKKIFRADEPPSKPPSDDVVEFFDDNREMFTRSVKEVMGKSWSRVPTQSTWYFGREVDPDKLNSWIFYNRDMVWRLIYGRGMEPPSK